MSKAPHHIVIGNGVAGSHAAAALRQRAPEARVTMVTMSSLLFYNRYDLPRVFRGQRDWRDYLVRSSKYYEDQRIGVRRNTRVANVDTRRRVVALEHLEELAYDSLLVASGGRSYLPEELVEFQPLMHGFANFEQAMTVARALPEGGRVVMLGGDMIGLDLARTLLDTGYRVTLVAGEYTFWPHEVSAEERERLYGALRKMGIEIVESGDTGGGIDSIEPGAKGMSARRIVFRNGGELYGDVVMPFFGLVPSVEFMIGSGVDIERGLLVKPSLRTTDANIYAAGDVCQIWDDAERRYRFYYGWKNVRAMGELSARNMTGEDEAFVPAQDEKLVIDPDGRIRSPFWEYE